MAGDSDRRHPSLSGPGWASAHASVLVKPLLTALKKRLLSDALRTALIWRNGHTTQRCGAKRTSPPETGIQAPPPRAGTDHPSSCPLRRRRR